MVKIGQEEEADKLGMTWLTVLLHPSHSPEASCLTTVYCYKWQFHWSPSAFWKLIRVTLLGFIFVAVNCWLVIRRWAQNFSKILILKGFELIVLHAPRIYIKKKPLVEYYKELLITWSLVHTSDITTSSRTI